MKSPQANLFDQLKTPSAKREQKRRLTHGGVKAKGKRKSQRPISTKQWMHLVLKSDVAKGKLSMLSKTNAKWIDQLIKEKAKKFGVDLKDLVNMGNHIHFNLRASKRDGFQNFLRSISALIARHVTGARRGKPFGKFWQDLAFTRILTSWIEITQLEKYFDANRVQRGQGYSAREKYRARANEYIQKLRRPS